MRIFTFFMLVFLCSLRIEAAEVSIRTITHNGVQTYELDAAAFPKESSALQLKLKLSSLLNKPVTIEQLKERQLYLVKIGPLEKLEEAEAVQRQLAEEHITTNHPTKMKHKESKIAEAPLAIEGKIWNLNNADIRAVIAEVSRVTGKNFLIDPRVQGKISIVSMKPLSNEALYQVFLSMLQVSGFAAVPLGDIVKIIPNMDAKSASFDLTNRGKGDEILVQVIPVLNVPSEQLIPVLRPLMPQWASISAYAPSNMLILSGRAANIKRMASIIKQVDSSSVNGVDMIPLQHALAMDVVATLKDLTKSNTKAGGAGGQAPVTIAADDRSNSILLSGSKTERIRYRLLIARLDKRSSFENTSNTQVVYLSYLRAEDLVPILAGIAQAHFSGNVGTTVGTITVPVLDSTNPASSQVNFNSGSGTTEQTAQTPSTNPQQGQGGNAGLQNTSGTATQNEGGTKPTVQIIAEPNTNSVIINAPVSVIRILKSVIRQLDIKPAQILIEALVAQVNERDVKDLGIEWGTTRLPDRNTTFQPGFVRINSTTSINDFQAQIYALERMHKANVLSTPSVLVLDNRQAKILVGKQVSVTDSNYPNNAGGTTASGSPYNTFKRVNVALHLYVRPQITRGRGINLQIDQGNDTLEPPTATTTEGQPVFNISSIVTSIHVESGNVIILGGLIQNETDKDDNQLPIVGNIPGIGRLFQRSIDTHEKRVLVVFIRPTILRSENDNLIVSGAKYNDMRQTELNEFRDDNYDKRNKLTILPPLATAQLPKPFTHLSARSTIISKRKTS